MNPVKLINSLRNAGMATQSKEAKRALRHAERSKRKFFAGLLLLSLVIVIWISSSELTKVTK